MRHLHLPRHRVTALRAAIRRVARQVLQGVAA
jgi:hypothetical protein